MDDEVVEYLRSAMQSMAEIKGMIRAEGWAADLLVKAIEVTQMVHNEYQVVIDRVALLEKRMDELEAE